MANVSGEKYREKIKEYHKLCEDCEIEPYESLERLLRRYSPNYCFLLAKGWREAGKIEFGTIKNARREHRKIHGLKNEVSYSGFYNRVSKDDHTYERSINEAVKVPRLPPNRYDEKRLKETIQFYIDKYDNDRDSTKEENLKKHH